MGTALEGTGRTIGSHPEMADLLCSTVLGAADLRTDSVTGRRKSNQAEQ